MKTVVLCGSRRFKKEIRKIGKYLKDNGVVVYEPHLHEGKDEWSNLSKEYKDFVALGLTYDHFQKIKMADVVYIVNKDGYSGVSTTLELGYAVALGKTIYALSDKDDELCRKVLFKDIVKTPQQLLKLL